VTASFIRELLRRDALVAADEDDSIGEITDAAITVTDGHPTPIFEPPPPWPARLALLGRPGDQPKTGPARPT